jgi:DNA-binding beta-propeller fold protein YncE
MINLGECTCPAGSAKATGKGTKNELGCSAEETTRPKSLAACETKEDARTQVLLGQAGGGTPCVNVASVMADIDNCEAAIVLSKCGTFLATLGSSFGTEDGAFYIPESVAVDGSGNVFVADTDNNRIQKFTNTGTFLTKWGSFGTGDGQFNGPSNVAVDGNGNVFVVDGSNSRIQKFTNTGTFLTTWGSTGSGDGQFSNLQGIAVDGSGNVFVVEFNNNRVQEFTNAGVFLTKWGSFGTGDGQFMGPDGVAVDGSGNVFVVDTQFGGGRSRIEKFTNSGIFLTTWGQGYFAEPRGIAVDGSGNVFVPDEASSHIQEFACP